MKENYLEEQYVQYCREAKHLIEEIYLLGLTDEQLIQRLLQLQDSLTLPITENSVKFLKEKILNLKRCMEEKSTQNQPIVENEGNSVHYTKVKKANGAYIPTEDINDIEVPNYNPIWVPKTSLREFPDYVQKDQLINVANVSPSNMGGSHIFMLALLSFIFETLFLILAFFLYR